MIELKKPIEVTKTFLPPIEEYTALLEKVYSSGWITNRGPMVKELEEKLKEKLSLDGSLLCVSNGTIALQLVFRALNLANCEVICTPFSYVASVSSMVWENLKPVFVDILPDKLTIDPQAVLKAIGKDTKAIFATHVYGNPCEVEKLAQIAKDHNLKLIYDASHCYDVAYKGNNLLNYGDASTISFHATKTFHTIEGGGIVTADEALAHRIFYMHHFGHKGEEDFYDVGINGKISEIHAAMGLVNLQYTDKIINHRKLISNCYEDILGANAKVRLLNYGEHTTRNYAYFPIVFESESLLKMVRSNLEAKGIRTRRYFYPSLDKLPYIKDANVCPVSQDISSRVLCLPLSYDLSIDSVKYISKQITDLLS